MSVADFVEALARTPATEHAHNPFLHGVAGNEIRRGNLSRYLEKILATHPEVLLVGEAPGYRGFRRVGVPFSSEKLLLTHPFFTSDPAFGVEHPDAPMAESSASIVWRTMDELSFYPLIWASFPFHPHLPGNPLSNRAPTRAETELGKRFLDDLIALSGARTVVAVGRVAERTLGEMGIAAHAVRHPSHGGATAFRDGLAAFIRARS